MKKGFTLIELMIVVAIIGILAAVAIPKFADLSAKCKLAKMGYDAEARIKIEKFVQAKGTILSEFVDNEALQNEYKSRPFQALPKPVLQFCPHCGRKLEG